MNGNVTFYHRLRIKPEMQSQVCLSSAVEEEILEQNSRTKFLNKILEI
jgi:hypothetical protein